MSSSSCPVCGRAIHEPRTIQVCTACHHDLRAAEHASVATTGEFSLDELVDLSAMSQARPPVRASPVSCTWCGRGESEVRKLLSHGKAHICNACVGLCADILQAELGNDWNT